MTYLVVENGIITNTIVAEPDFAETIGAKEYYEGAAIGLEYDPPEVEEVLGIEEYVKATNYLELIKTGKFAYADMTEEVQHDIRLVAKDQVVDGKMTEEEYKELLGEEYKA